MSHFLEPSDDDNDLEVVKKTKESQRTSPESKAKQHRVKIQIEEDDDDEGCDGDGPLVVEAAKQAAARDENKKAHATEPKPAAVHATPPTAAPASQPAPAATPANAAAIQQQQQQQQQTCINVAGASESMYHFVPAPRPFPMLQPPVGSDPEIAQYMLKWGLAQSMEAVMFKYEQVASSNESKSASLPGQVHAGMLPELILSLLNSDAFRAAFRCGDGRGGHVSLCYPTPAGAAAVTLQQLTARETTMSMFDKLADSHPDSMLSLHGGPSIVRDTGALARCADVFLPAGINVSDQLRSLLMLGDEAEAYNLFSEAERKEFLFHVFHRVVAGGAVCQYEDEAGPYKEAVKEIYKSLISVGKKKGCTPSSADDVDGNEGPKLEVQSLACQITDVKVKDDKTGKLKSAMKSCFFPKDDRTGNHNWMYAIVDPIRRTIVVWYNAFHSPF